MKNYGVKKLVNKNQNFWCIKIGEKKRKNIYVKNKSIGVKMQILV